jgi:hypothetical protein
MCESTTEFQNICSKVKKVICKCENKKQLETARNYVENFYKIFVHHPELKFVREDIEELFSQTNQVIH